VSHFNIIKQVSPQKTFRVQQLLAQYDLQTEKYTQSFIGEIDLNFDWNVGIIYGHSGTGKSVISKELFSNNYFQSFHYASESILDDMPKEKTTKEIFQAFNSVGFSSPPDYLKPYSVLSTGQKMRVDIARCLLEDKELIVFDEFTSVVDRVVAQIGSHAIQKAIRKNNKKFIAVSCHEDIIEWLEPDWVFCTNDMTFKNTRGLLRRPAIELKIHECSTQFWKMFKNYHYLNSDINKAGKCFIMTVNNKIAGFTSVLHFPHPKERKFKREHRTVILPNYQGVGLGSILSEQIAQLYVENGFRYISTTSNPAFIKHRKNNKNWKLREFGRKTRHHDLLDFKGSDARNTTSWEYIINKNLTQTKKDAII
jgi:alpha-D-ribose 1-methylphosphonate 5-triphosphate synthase subunit PhnL/GNAT superfamily N-acetyltransferase